MRGRSRLRRTQRYRLRSTNGVNDQISSFSTKRPSEPAAGPGRRRMAAPELVMKTAGMEARAAQHRPSRPSSRPSRMMVSNEISAARKFGTARRIHTPSVSGTRKNASSASVCAGRRCSAKNSRRKVDPRQDAGHRRHHAQLHQHGDQDELVCHRFTLNRRGNGARYSFNRKSIFPSGPGADCSNPIRS